MDLNLLKDVLIILLMAIGVLLVCHRLKVPAIVGYLITGALIGPHGLGLVASVHEVELLAEIGIVLLLFTIGIEFSLKRLMRIKRQVLIGGGLQVGLTTAAVYGIAVGKGGLAPPTALFVGFLVSLSSTAIVLQILQERATIDSSHGRLSLAVLIFQDIVIVPMMLFTPLLAGSGGDPSRDLLILAAKTAGVVLLMAAAGLWAFPWLFGIITRTRSRELFLLSVVVSCFAVAWLTSSIGLSLALGAFMAGLVISESEYSHQVLGNALPLRGLFTSFFFVSVGMLLNAEVVWAEPLPIILGSLGVMALNSFIAALAAMVLGYPLQIALIAGLTLSQIGEFSFVLSRVGLEYGLLDQRTYELFLAVSVLTMLKTPLVIAAAPRLAAAVARLPWPRRLLEGFAARSLGLDDSQGDGLSDHLIITGFGINGRNVARAARAASISYVVVEMNPETVSLERARGESIFYGDASQAAVLVHAGIGRARVLVTTVPDAATARSTIALARKLNPGLHLIARTRFLPEVDALYELGADEVIPEEFETSVEIFTRVLNQYLVPRDQLERFAAEIRADGYGLFRRTGEGGTPPLAGLRPHLHGVEIANLSVARDSPLAGRTLAEEGLRRVHGVTVVAVYRGDRLFTGPDGPFLVKAGDELVVLAPPEKLPGVLALVRGEAE